MVSKALFLEVHTEVAKWRWLVLHWFRQLLRDYAPFDVARRLHFDMVYTFENTINRYRFQSLTPTGYYNVKRVGDTEEY